MHYVKRYIGYVIALVVITSVVVYIAKFNIRHVPPKHSQMAPLIKPDQWIVISKVNRDTPEIENGDVVQYIYRHPKFDSASEIFMGRIMALEGERIAIKNGDVYRARAGSPRIDFEKDRISEVYLDAESTDRTMNFHEIVIPQGHVFILSDNRVAAWKAGRRIELFHGDSRFLGPLSKHLIVGKISVD